MVNSDRNVQVIVDLAVYSQTAVLKASYKFTDRWYVHIATAQENTIAVSFTPKVSAPDSYDLRGEFLNELLDQRLREHVGSETLAVRNLIMAHALSQLDWVQSHGDANDTSSEE